MLLLLGVMWMFAGQNLRFLEAIREFAVYTLTFRRVDPGSLSAHHVERRGHNVKILALMILRTIVGKVPCTLLYLS